MDRSQDRCWTRQPLRVGCKNRATPDLEPEPQTARPDCILAILAASLGAAIWLPSAVVLAQTCLQPREGARAQSLTQIWLDAGGSTLTGVALCLVALSEAMVVESEGPCALSCTQAYVYLNAGQEIIALSCCDIPSRWMLRGSEIITRITWWQLGASWFRHRWNWAASIQQCANPTSRRQRRLWESDEPQVCWSWKG